MNVRSAMLEHPVTTHPEETFGELLSRLVVSRQATAAVLDDRGKLLGLVGIHDILRKIVPVYVDLDTKLMEVMHENYLEERMSRLKDTRVRDFMTTELDTVSPDDTLIKAVVIIVEHRRKTLPVVQEGKFLGMVTRRSILEKVAPNLL